ncbi:nucleoside transporter-domain-containing protein [Bisporella sp. PMI_857]|nr:nucleoside transporter-domain-containing protein [Bisporella sp. PMI_857]
MVTARAADPQSTMETLRAFFRKSSNTEQDYGPIQEDFSDEDDNVRRPVSDEPSLKSHVEPFSWFEFSIFLLLGVAMLWAWNMFMAAGPYFQTRFVDSERILSSFQSAITSVATTTNLGSMLVLMNMQSKASYPRRIIVSLVINVVVFILLAISTNLFRGVSSTIYLAFTLVMVFSTSYATGLCQNGAFAFAASFGRPEYLQAIMTGQAIAGVLPSVAQISSVLAVPEPDHYEDPDAFEAAVSNGITNAAFIYFMLATVISGVTLLAIVPLIRKHDRLIQSQMGSSVASVEEAEQSKRKVVSMWTLYKKLHWLAAAVFLCFLVTMFFPVFTQKIVSIVPSDEASRIFKPNAFIPLGFLIWNIGDLLGRLSASVPFPAGARYRRPEVLFLFSVLRGGFVPLYLLCNIEDHGAKIKSDFFYLFIVQFLFGLTNGWLGSSCMMDFAGHVDEGEREAAGGFMALNLVAGLMSGSLLSFTVTGIH